MTGTRKWHDAELVGLIAWIDLCIKRKLDFDDTIVPYLKTITEEHVGDTHEFTVSAIKTKLVRFQSPGSRQLSATEILAKGSCCFQSFVSENQAAFEEAVRSYSTVSRAKEKKKQESRHIKANVDEGHPATKTNSSEMYGGSEEQLSSTQARMKKSLATSGNIKNQGPQAQSSQSSKSAGSAPGMNGGRPCQSNTAQASQKALKTTDAQMSNNQKPGDQHATQLERLRLALKQKDTQIGILRAQWQAEAEAAHTRESHLKATEAELRAENSLLKVAQQEREQAGKDPLESTLFKKNHDIWDLTQRLMKMQKLHSFAARDSLHKTSMEHRVVDEALDRIADDLEFMLNGHDLTQPLAIPKIEENSDLGCLVRSIFGQGQLGTSADRNARLKQSAAKFGAGPVLRTFSVAAIGEWVFSSNFPNFVPNSIRLLQAYREAVMGHDGWTRLRNLELAAYSKLIKEDHFQQKILPQKAEDLAVRLSRALAPFFPTGVNGSQQEGFETWGQEKIVWADRKFRMTEVFEGALRLKAATVTTDHVFDFVVNMPGSTGSNIASDSQDSSTSINNIQSHGDFHRLASFHIYSGKASTLRDLMADALVQSRNFIDKALFMRSDKPLYTKCIRVQNLDSVLQLAADIDNETPAEDRVPSVDGERQTPKQGKAASPESSTPAISTRNIDDDLPFKCQICQRQFKVKWSLTRHERDDECSQCLACGIFFAKPVDLRRHQKTEHDHPKPLEVDEKQGKRKALSVALDDSDDSELSDVWEISSEDQESPRKRRKMNKYARNHACNECGQAFFHGKGLEKHIVSEHATIIEDSPGSSDTALHGDNTAGNSRDTRETPAKDLFVNAAVQKKQERDLRTPQDPAINFKCPVCPEVLSSVLSRDDHFNSHPPCFQTGVGHVIDQKSLAQDQVETACQVCGKRLLRRIEAQAEKDTRTIERPTSLQQHTTDDGVDTSRISNRQRECFDFLAE